MKCVIIVLSIALFGLCSCDVSHILDQPAYHHEDDYLTTTTTPPPPPHPYVFSYTAGRYPGHVDRTHSEVSDGSGTVRGAYSYIDPRQQVRTVEYVADENGFHPILSHPQKQPQQSAAVQRETERHRNLYNKIAEQNLHPQVNVVYESAPKDTVAVANAKERHFNLFDKIAQEHAHIAAEREAERLRYESTASPNELYPQENHVHVEDVDQQQQQHHHQQY